MTARTRSRYGAALLGIVLCAVSYTIMFDEDEILLAAPEPVSRLGGEASVESRRRLSFLDAEDEQSDRVGMYKFSNQYQSLTRPSDMNSRVFREVLPVRNEGSKHDSSCDDVLLFLPSHFARDGHGRQLNAYLLAVMIATYSNKAMIVLEAPRGRIEFDGASQFGRPREPCEGCPREALDLLPRGLSRLVRPSDHLSSACPVPCQGSYRHKDWEDMMEARKRSVYYPKVYTPNEVSCTNDNGRQTKVLVMGGDEARDYFEHHFRAEMAKRPPVRSSYGWATRLGASHKEAEAFSKLKGERDIWDYVSALVARSGHMRFQPWISRDVERYIQSTDLPLDAPYDVMHLRRGDKLKHDEETRKLVGGYWKDKRNYSPLRHYGFWTKKKVVKTNYFPIQQYLRQFDDIPCNPGKVPRYVYVSTDDPNTVRNEISLLTKHNKVRPENKFKPTHVDWGCHRFKFVFSPAAPKIKEMQLHGGLPHGDSTAEDRYDRAIAGVADLMIAARATTYVGEFDSEWGRLVRTFRMRLVEDDEGGGVRATERGTRAAWGDVVPPPPGS